MRQSVGHPLLIAAAGGSLVLISATSCDSGSPASTENLTKMREGSAGFRSAEIRALSGSAEVTDDLIEFYSQCHERPGYTAEREKECRSRFEYWIRIGLENGSAVAQQRQASSILQSNSCYDAYRAEYFYGRFKRHFRASPEFLKSVGEEIAEKKKACVWQLKDELITQR